LDIKSLHALGMTKLHSLMGVKVIVKYKENMYAPIQVTATVGEDKDKLLSSDVHIVGKKTKVFNILVDNILAEDGSLTNIDTIIYNFEHYKIQYDNYSSVFEDTLELYGVLLDV